jgi:hypothetical protein
VRAPGSVVPGDFSEAPRNYIIVVGTASLVQQGAPERFGTVRIVASVLPN